MRKSKMNPIEGELYKRLSGGPFYAEGTVRGSFTLDENFPAFQGHFPGAPVCPAVAEVRAALLLMELTTGGRYAFGKLSNAKFLKPLLPGDRIDVEIAVPGEDCKAAAKVMVGETVAAKFTLHFPTEP